MIPRGPRGLVEDLHAVVVSVSDVDVAAGISGHGVYAVEFTPPVTLFIPVRKIVSLGVEFDDARVV